MQSGWLVVVVVCVRKDVEFFFVPLQYVREPLLEATLESLVVTWSIML